MMKLAIDGRELVPGRVTGIQRFLIAILEEIARRPHLETLVLGYFGQHSGVQAPHVRAETLSPGPTLYWDQVVLPRALQRVGATVFFSPYYKAPLGSPCPTIVTIHDLIPIQFPIYTRGCWRFYGAAFRCWSGLMARRAAAVITDSEYSKSDLISLLRLSADRIHVIPLGVGDEFRPDLPPDAVTGSTARYGISKPYLLAVGNFLPHKNLSRLVEAYGMLPERIRSHISLVLAGTPAKHGAARPTDRAALTRPGVLLPGFISPQDLPALYAGATALVCPSLTEGFGLPVLEAMACGAPVVCARAGSLPEVAGDAALYVDPLDIGSIRAGMEQIIQDADLRATLSARGLDRAKLFDSRHTTARLVDLLERVARGGAA
jgi:glycosyltransferase involved in cell wall biosynthesis